MKLVHPKLTFDHFPTLKFKAISNKNVKNFIYFDY